MKLQNVSFDTNMPCCINSVACTETFHEEFRLVMLHVSQQDWQCTIRKQGKGIYIDRQKEEREKKGMEVFISKYNMDNGFSSNFMVNDMRTASTH